MNWLTHQLRFSAFVPDATPQMLDTIWPLISSEPAESDESRPREGFRRMAAPETDSVLEVVVRPGRFDIIKSPAAMGEIQPVVDFGEAKPQLEAFAIRIHSLLDSIGDKVSLYRLALGVILLRLVPNREAAYEELGKLLPVKVDSVNSLDFLFQINYPQLFSIGNNLFALNRLSRWSAIQTQRFMLQVVPNTVGETMLPRAGLVAGENYVRCEIDNSSAAEMTEEIPSESWWPIFDRLIALAYVTSNGENSEIS